MHHSKRFVVTFWMMCDIDDVGAGMLSVSERNG